MSQGSTPHPSTATLMLDAGLEILQERGLASGVSSASFRDVAAELGVGPNAVSSLWPSHRAFESELVRRRLAEDIVGVAQGVFEVARDASADDTAGRMRPTARRALEETTVLPGFVAYVSAVPLTSEPALRADVLRRWQRSYEQTIEVGRLLSGSGTEPTPLVSVAGMALIQGAAVCELLGWTQPGEATVETLTETLNGMLSVLNATTDRPALIDEKPTVHEPDDDRRLALDIGIRLVERVELGSLENITVSSVTVRSKTTPSDLYHSWHDIVDFREAVYGTALQRALEEARHQRRRAGAGNGAVPTTDELTGLFATAFGRHLAWQLMVSEVRSSRPAVVEANYTFLSGLSEEVRATLATDSSKPSADPDAIVWLAMGLEIMRTLAGADDTSVGNATAAILSAAIGAAT